jgi:hypothetical protein
VRPAGFGKTSLLGDWARGGQPPVAWLSLDAGDNDPVRFWRYVCAALDPAGEGVAGQVGPLLGGPQPVSLEAVVTAVVNALAGLPDQVALVVDDYHLIEAAPVHDSLGLLLERLPAQLRLVVASRAVPPLPLARLRARGQLAELRERDLRFMPHETAALLGDVMGLELPTASVAALAARTEGWVAGLQLAGLSLRDHADPAGFVASFSGSHRYLLDYLVEEVLARQPEEIVQFLLETSVLERLSDPCATRSPAAATASSCWSRWSGPTCSWCRWMRCGAGGVTTSCSPTCSRPASNCSGLSGYPGCTGPRSSGASSTGWPTTPCAMRWRPVMSHRPSGWSSGTSTRSSCAPRGTPCSGGLRRCRLSWSAPGHGCCWLGSA